MLEGRDAGPRLTAWMVHHARSSDLRLHGRTRRTHAIQAIEGAQGSARRWQVSVNACGPRTPILGRENKSIRDARRGGCLDSASSRPATSWWTLTGDSAWARRSREPALTTDGKLCHQEILSQPPIWSQRQPNSLVREELGEKSIPLHNDWRGIRFDAQLPDPDHDPSPEEAFPQAERLSWRTGRQIAVRVAE